MFLTFKLLWKGRGPSLSGIYPPSGTLAPPSGHSWYHPCDKWREKIGEIKNIHEINIGIYRPTAPPGTDPSVQACRWFTSLRLAAVTFLISTSHKQIVSTTCYGFSHRKFRQSYWLRSRCSLMKVTQLLKRNLSLLQIVLSRMICADFKYSVLTNARLFYSGKGNG